MEAATTGTTPQNFTLIKILQQTSSNGEWQYLRSFSYDTLPYNWFENTSISSSRYCTV